MSCWLLASPLNNRRIVQFINKSNRTFMIVTYTYLPMQMNRRNREEEEEGDD